MAKHRFIERLMASEALDIKEWLIKNYKKLGLNETEAMLLLHLCQMKKQGNRFLSIKQLTERMSLDFRQCSDLVLSLVQRGFVAFEIDYDDKGIARESYTLTPLYEKIGGQLMDEHEELQQQDVQNAIAELIQLIENQFGRTCSSFEIQLIASWINDYQFSIDLIKLALKEALLAEAHNLKYVDRILLNWRSKNIHTVEDAEHYTKTYRKFETHRKERETHQEEEEYVSWMKS